MKEPFSGFHESKKRFIGIPDQFFSEVLTGIDDINELKLVLFILWAAYTRADFGLFFCEEDFLEDHLFMDGLAADNSNPQDALNKALNLAVDDGIILKVNEAEKKRDIYFINSPRGRAAAELAHTGKSRVLPDATGLTLDIIQPNIYRLYEENIGPLTPLIAETLRETESAYPAEWITEAIEIAVRNNVRRWKYVVTILSRWQEEGRDGTHPRNDQEDYRRYIKGKYGEFGKY